MAKAKYKITKEDSPKAWLYIENKLSDQNYPDEEFNFENKEEFRNIQPNANSKINKWCEKHLNKKQWQQLKDSIRAKRSRAISDKKSVDLERNAWKMLSTIAKFEDVTLSQAIERHLKNTYMKIQKNNAELYDKM